MKKALFDKYNSLKEEFIKAIKEEVKSDTKISVQFYSVLDYGQNICGLVEITELHYDEKGSLLAHIFITEDNTLETEEYWHPLEDLAFDDLYQIVEKL